LSVLDYHHNHLRDFQYIYIYIYIYTRRTFSWETKTPFFFSLFLHSTFSLNFRLHFSPSIPNTLHEEVQPPGRRRRCIRHRCLTFLLLPSGSENVSPFSMPKIKMNYYFVNKGNFLSLAVFFSRMRGESARTLGRRNLL